MLGAGGRKWETQFQDDFNKYVTGSLALDQVGRTIKSDNAILLLGKIQFEKLGKMRAGDVRSTLRLIARVKQQLRNITGNTDEDINFFIDSAHFDNFVQAVKCVCIVPADKKKSVWDSHF